MNTKSSEPDLIDLVDNLIRTIMSKSMLSPKVQDWTFLIRDNHATHGWEASNFLYFSVILTAQLLSWTATLLKP